MCGISGAVSKYLLTPETKAAVARMSAAQLHRGPDGEGVFDGERIALASRRLSIIDPLGGWQPLYNEDESLVLVINGEIYNYIELRARLKSTGHRFRTETDGEVILHLYEENPANFIDHLRGMFAFALWDTKRRRLILARDRMGEKPLYLFQTDNQLIFASEMKSLLASGLVPFELDPRAVNLYFHYQYVPEPLTAVRGVRKLDAATMLVVDTDTWRIDEKIYWRMEDSPPLDGVPEILIREKLEEVSTLIVRSDMPVGVALSGGLDSSIVASFASRRQPNLHAFSVGYPGRPEPDERADAEKLARYLDLPYFDVELDTGQIVDFFPELNFWRDDPVADISGFGYYAVMKLAREKGVPVMLQGQGGDELFWGYPQLREGFEATTKKDVLLKSPFWQKVLQTFNRGRVRSGRRLVESSLRYPERMVFYDAAPDFATAAEQIGSFYTKNFRERIDPTAAFALFTLTRPWPDIGTTLTSLICATYLRENGITQGDRLGMASSVELRLPLIDHLLVETVVGLRKAQSDARLAPKYWLREAVKDILPAWALDRPKRGFAPPTREWHEALFAAYGDSLRGGFLVQNEILSSAGGLKMAAGEFPGNATSPLSFKALVLEQWCRGMKKITNYELRITN